MNAKERILNTLNHIEPDKVPSFEFGISNNSIRKHLGFPPDESQMGLDLLEKYPIKEQNIFLKQMMKNVSIFKEGYRKTYEFYHRAGMDLVWATTTLYPRKIVEFNDGKEGVGFVDEYGRIMRFVRHTSGEFILNYNGAYFKSYEDYEMWEPRDPELDLRLKMFLAGKEVQAEMKNKVFCAPTVAGLFDCVWEGFGIDQFSRILVSPKKAKKIFDDAGMFVLELIKILVENGAELILLLDDYGFKNGLFMNPKHYKTYIIPWLKKICTTAHKQGSKILLHSDGDLYEIVADLIQSGIDALHPIEPTTANPDYDIFKLHKTYGDQITFVGNLSPNLLSDGTISEIETYAKRLIRELAPGGGYIFSSGHSTTPQVTLDRWLAMQNIKEKYGNYPINVPE